MVLVCFGLHIAALGIFHFYRFRIEDNHFAYGWEMGRIGQAIALGQGFASPYGGSTGPTAWEPPLYPYLIGGVFKVFGIYSNASAIVLLSINSLFTALTCIPIFFVGKRVFGEKVALWSAWVWALLPYAMYWSLHWIWDTTFAPLLLSLVFLVALKLETWSGWKGWIWFGILWGVIALSNPSMLSFLPCCGLWVWYRRSKRRTPSFGGVVAASLVFFAVISPWIVRNHAVFGKFMFVRNDFGYELRLGNGPSAGGRLMAYLQPNLNVLELQIYTQLGEPQYEERCKRMAFEWIRENPKRFAIVSLKRFFYYWDNTTKETNSKSPVDFRNSGFLATSVLSVWGIFRAVRKKLPGAWLFLWLILVFPTVYYFVYPGARYRHPIEPELLIPAVFLLSEAGKRVVQAS